MSTKLDYQQVIKAVYDETNNALKITGGGGGGNISDINGATGPSINILPGTNVSVNTVGNNITINSTASGSVTDVTATSPIVSSGGATPNISITLPLPASDIGGATPNTFAGFDGTGVLESIPGFSIDTTTGGLNEGITYNPNDLGGGQNLNTFTFNLVPLQDSPNDDYNNQQVSLLLDPTSTGFQLGTNGEAATNLNLYVQHHGTSNTGSINQIKTYFDLGNGTDPIDVKGLGYMFGFADINSGVTLSGPIQGYNFQPHIHTGVILGGGYNTAPFADFANFEVSVPGFTSFNASPNLLAVNTNNAYNAFGANPTITTLTGAAAFNGFSVSGNITTMGANAGVKGFDFSPNITTSHGSVQGMNINPNILGGDANYTGISINVNGSPTGLQNVTGLNINLGTVPTTDPNGVSGISSDARLQINAETQLNPGLTFQIGNRIESLLHVHAGTPVTNTDALGNNFAGDLWAEDDVADGITAGIVGWTGVGFISSVIVASGKTVDTANIFLAAGAIPTPPSGTDGGTITNLSMIKTVAPLNQGGTLNVTNLKMLNVAGTVVGAATNVWGLYVEDTALNSYIGGKLGIGQIAPTESLDIGAGNLLVENGTIKNTVAATDAATQNGSISSTANFTYTADPDPGSSIAIAGLANISLSGAGFTTTSNSLVDGVAGYVSITDDGSTYTFNEIDPVHAYLSTNAPNTTIDQVSTLLADMFLQDGIITNLYGLRIRDSNSNAPSGTNAVTNYYGIYSEASAFGTKKNWIAGKSKLGYSSFTAPTAILQLPASTTSAGSAPIKIDPGTLMTTPENGAVESDGTDIYWTNSGGTRIALSGAGKTEVSGIYDLLTTNYAITADTVIKYNTVTYESHPGAYSASTGLFTVPAGQGGRYRVSVVGDVTTGGGTVYITVNGTNVGYLFAFTATSTTNSGTRIVNVAAGDTIGIFGDTIALYVANSPSVNNFSIEKV